MCFCFWTHPSFPFGELGTFALFKLPTLWWGTYLLKWKVIYLKLIKGFNRTLSIHPSPKAKNSLNWFSWIWNKNLYLIKDEPVSQVALWQDECHGLPQVFVTPLMNGAHQDAEPKAIEEQDCQSVHYVKNAEIWENQKKIKVESCVFLVLTWRQGAGHLTSFFLREGIINDPVQKVPFNGSLPLIWRNDWSLFLS